MIPVDEWRIFSPWVKNPFGVQAITIAGSIQNRIDFRCDGVDNFYDGA
jgi:hypothetical protein